MNSAQFSILNEQYSNKSGDYYGQDRKEMQSLIPVGIKSILDVGCSNGQFGANLKKQNPYISVWGIEPFKEAADIAKEVLDNVVNNVFNTELPELKNKKFDCITFNDVLEHLVNPEQALQDCHVYLNKDGYVVASIPNILYFPIIFEVLKKEDWKYESVGILDNTHLRFFTEKSIIRLFEENGFKIVKIEGINSNKTKLYRILNLLLLNRLKNWKYRQYAVLAQKADLHP